MISLSIHFNNKTYLLRKVWKDVAKTLYQIYSKLKDAVESIVGYLKTLSGNFYIISEIPAMSWAFDKRIAKEDTDIHYLDIDKLDQENKDRLVELIIDNLVYLHHKNFIMGSFSLNNLLLFDDGLKFTDLRKVRESRKRFLVIEEFKNIMQYLIALNIASKDDIYYAVALYASKNEEVCKEWCREKKGCNPESDESEDIIDVLEKEILF